MHYKIPLILAPQPEGGFTVTSPLLPELITEGDTMDEALKNVKDALAAVVEVSEQLPPLTSNKLNPATHLFIRHAVVHEAKVADNLADSPRFRSTIGNPGVFNSIRMELQEIVIDGEDNAAFAERVR